jgi:hypothetical protein
MATTEPALAGGWSELESAYTLERIFEGHSRSL